MEKVKVGLIFIMGFTNWPVLGPSVVSIVPHSFCNFNFVILLQVFTLWFALGQGSVSAVSATVFLIFTTHINCFGFFIK